jgi:hypothetical protein
VPKIMSHHLHDAWQPRLEWPEEVAVQWGGHGVVLAKDPNKSYKTAFFEVFPHDGSAGFIRGEGMNLEEAESNAFAKWSKQKACFNSSGHQWSRTLRKKNGTPSTYLNGGCFCLKCKSFETAMKPIVELGAWRKPLSSSELEMIANGWCRICKKTSEFQDKDSDRYNRKLWLRARLHGIALPEQPQNNPYDLFPTDNYTKACRKAVVLYVSKHLEALNSPTQYGMQGLFDGLSTHFLRSLLEDGENDEYNQTGSACN